MSVGDRDVNSGLFRAQQENSTCLCVSVTRALLVFTPLVCPSQPALLSVQQAASDMLNHSLFRSHTHLHVPLADSLERIPPQSSFQIKPAKSVTLYPDGICRELLPTRQPTGGNFSSAGRGLGSLYGGGKWGWGCHILYNFSDVELSPMLAGG